VVLHGDGGQRGERGRAHQHALGEIGMKPHPFGLRVAERAGLVPDGVRHAQAAQVVDQPGPPDQRRGRLTQPEHARRLPGQVGHATRMADGVRRLHVGEVGDGLQRGIDVRLGQPHAQGRFRADDRVPAAGLVQAREQSGRLADEHVHDLRVELRPTQASKDA